MKKNMLIAAILLAMLIGLSGCCTIAPGKVIYSKALSNTIDDVGAKAAILVTSDGRVLVYNEKGDRENVNECVLPEPEKKPYQKKAAQTQYQEVEPPPPPPPGVCRGMTKGSAVTSIQTISILKSNSKDCVTIGADSAGNPIEICWTVP